MTFVQAQGVLPRERWALPHSYTPPKGKRILVLLPCAKTKPYANSPFHRAINSSLRGVDGEVHYCTISEVAGIVPRELENTVPPYDTYPDKVGMAAAASALVSYLTRYSDYYGARYAYATSKCFRSIVKEASAKSKNRIALIPADGHFRPESAFFEFMKHRSRLRTAVQSASQLDNRVARSRIRDPRGS